MRKSKVYSFSMKQTAKEKTDVLMEHYDLGFSDLIVKLVEKEFERVEKRKCMQLKKS